MTDKRPVEREEVERVFKALLQEYEEHQHRGDYPKELLYNVPEIPLPRKGTKARAVLDALRLAWCANVRFVRADHAKHAQKRGERIYALEDERRDAAIASVERAHSLVQKAAELLNEDFEVMNRQASRWKGSADPELHEDANQAGLAAARLEKLLTRLGHFKGIRQIRTQGDWDEFLTDSAAALLDVGFSNREVAALLTGQDPSEVDRATMERCHGRDGQVLASHEQARERSPRTAPAGS